MGKLNDDHKNYIKNNIELSNQKIADKLLVKFGLEITKEGVRKFKKSCRQPKKVVAIPGPPKSRIPKPESTFKYPEGIDDLMKLLDSMKGHYWYNYIYKQSTGKLRSDFQKLFEIMRDAKRKHDSLVRT